MPEETEQNEESPEESPEEETGETAVDEDEETAEEDQGAGGLGNLLSPEGFVMMSVATTIDLISIIIVFVGLDDFGITDTIGLIIIGSWMFFKSGILFIILFSDMKTGLNINPAPTIKIIQINKNIFMFNSYCFINHLLSFFPDSLIIKTAKPMSV